MLAGVERSMSDEVNWRDVRLYFPLAFTTLFQVTKVIHVLSAKFLKFRKLKPYSF